MDAPIPQWLKSRLITDNNNSVELKPAAVSCEDCGETVINRTVKYSISKDKNTDPHWIVRCTHCKQYRNPETGVFDSSIYKLNAFYKSKKTSER